MYTIIEYIQCSLLPFRIWWEYLIAEDSTYTGQEAWINQAAVY